MFGPIKDDEVRSFSKNSRRIRTLFSKSTAVESHWLPVKTAPQFMNTSFNVPERWLREEWQRQRSTDKKRIYLFANVAICHTIMKCCRSIRSWLILWKRFRKEGNGCHDNWHKATKNKTGFILKSIIGLCTNRQKPLIKRIKFRKGTSICKNKWVL